MWEKWVFLASLAGLDLPDAHVGRQHPGVAPAARTSSSALLDGCSAVATAEGYAPPVGPFFQRIMGMLTTEGSSMTASMFRDIKASVATVEADHVIGDLVARAMPRKWRCQAAYRLYPSQGI